MKSFGSVLRVAAVLLVALVHSNGVMAAEQEAASANLRGANESRELQLLPRPGIFDDVFVFNFFINFEAIFCPVLPFLPICDEPVTATTTTAPTTTAPTTTAPMTAGPITAAPITTAPTTMAPPVMMSQELVVNTGN